MAPVLLAVVLLWPGGAALAAPAAQSTCQYVLGFLLLYQSIPQIMGNCLDNETPAPNGDSLQHTERGLAVYRSADNWTAFTDGHRTWINGPFGIQQRLNTERFSWEADAGAPGTTVIPGGPVGFDPARVAVRLEPFVRGLASPVGLAAAPDGSSRLYVLEKRGTIRVIANGALQAAPFLDIQRLVRAVESERGLLGLAFHPSYAQNGYFYVNYTDLQGHTVIARYIAGPQRTTADPNSAQVLLRIEQPAANHNGGHLLFGPDGYLWIGTGDGGGAGDQFGQAQNPGTLLGKMLRIDVNRAEGGRPYAIPPDNPFVGVAGFRPEIWAIGLRNPWRYSFDRLTGDLYIADVGQNAWEEVNFVPASTGGGLNFGWPRLEATHCFRPATNCDRSGLVMPVAEYTRSEGISVTGGFVYRGQVFPQLAGAYFFGDFGSGRIWSLHRDAAGNWIRTEVARAGIQISSFGEDEAGEIYVAGMGDGVIYRLAASNR